jgi:hypothetical protein
MKNNEKHLKEPSKNISKKKYRIRIAETEEAEQEIKEFDRYEPIPENEDHKTIS